MANKKNLLVTEFTMWKDNRLDGKFEINVAEAVDKFKQSKMFQDHQNGAMFERCLLSFLSAQESEGGLQAVHEISDFDQISYSIYKLIYP